MISNETRQKWFDKVEAINECVTLTPWEKDFMVSVESWLYSGKDISMKQSLVLNKIYERAI